MEILEENEIISQDDDFEKTNNRKLFGKRLDKVLTIRKIKQKELAKALNTIDNTISYFVSGSRSPNMEQLIKISKYLNVSVDYLLGLTDVMGKNSDVRSISDRTGLSESAIKNLIRFKERSDMNLMKNVYYLNSINHLLSSEIIPFLHYVAEYKFNLKTSNNMNGANHYSSNALYNNKNEEEFEIPLKARISLLDAVDAARRFAEDFARTEDKNQAHKKIQDNQNSKSDN